MLVQIPFLFMLVGILWFFLQKMFLPPAMWFYVMSVMWTSRNIGIWPTARNPMKIRIWMATTTQQLYSWAAVIKGYWVRPTPTRVSRTRGNSGLDLVHLFPWVPTVLPKGACQSSHCTLWDLCLDLCLCLETHLPHLLVCSQCSGFLSLSQMGSVSLFTQHLHLCWFQFLPSLSSQSGLYPLMCSSNTWIFLL